MDLTDFKESKKYKVIMPALYVISWILMFVGPHYFPVTFMNMYMVLAIYFLYKSTWLPIVALIVFIQSWKHMNNLKKAQEGKSYESLVARPDEEINHAFIIPNYKQQIQLIEQTLDILASHKRSKSNYLIFLAMEAHEEGSELKAQTLIKKYQSSFRIMEYTHHKIRQHEQKGKASNVNWCAQNLQVIFQKNAINPDSVMITIIDADSWAPDLYIDVLQKKINQQYDQRHLRIYQPIQIFTRNYLDVPVVTRVYDILHSNAHIFNLFSFWNVTFSLSNYTLSYNLVKRIGFWDTVPEAIGEDFHMVMKAQFKTKHNIKPTPIYVPFNQVNISTGNGYWADCKARFWQAQRHAKGVADVAYCFYHFLKDPCSKMSFLLFFFVFEAFCLGAIVPWLTIGALYQSQILYPGVDLGYIYSTNTLNLLFVIMSCYGTVGYILYEIMKRRANKVIYKRQNQSIWRVLQFYFLCTIFFVIIGIPTFTIAAWRTLLGKSDYVVADKKISKQVSKTSSSS